MPWVLAWVTILVTCLATVKVPPSLSALHIMFEVTVFPAVGVIIGSQSGWDRSIHGHPLVLL
jgi:hypothetical protein